MKLKSAAGYACYVKDLDKTLAFYESLGLPAKERTANRAIIYLNWYRIDFLAADTYNPAEVQAELNSDTKGTGVFLYFSVDDVDAAYVEAVKLGLKPACEPHDVAWGNREFIIEDPDGYKLVLFKRKLAKNPLD